MATADSPTTGDWLTFWAQYPDLVFHRVTPQPKRPESTPVDFRQEGQQDENARRQEGQKHPGWSHFWLDARRWLDLRLRPARSLR